MAVLQQRRDAHSQPGSRSDAYRVGLAIEGGGMRGVVSGGMVVALEQMGLRNAFDSVYGSSAGAFNAMYFLTGEASCALPLYYDAMRTSDFLDVRRWLRRAPVLSVEWILDVAMERLVPLDWDSALSSDIELHVIASSIDEMRPVAFTDFTSRADLRTALMASARIPFLAGPPIRHRGHELLDAAVLQAHPYEAAFDDGCTHVLSLSTRPRGRMRPPARWTERLLAARLNHLKRGLGDSSLTRIGAYRRAQVHLRELTDEPGSQPFVLDIAPEPPAIEVAQFDRDLRRVIGGACAGYEAAYLVLEETAVRAVVKLDHLRIDTTRP